LLGPDLLVAPKLTAGAARYRVTLPRGDWYDTETLAPVEGGPHDIEPRDSSVRLFARAGAIIPEAPVLQRAELSGKLTLTVWPGASCHGALYVDDGQSFAYAAGKSRRVAFTCEAAAKSLSVQASSQGEYPAWWQEVELVLHAVPSAPSSLALADGKPLPHSYDAAKKTLVVKLSGSVTDFKLGVGW
jgi:alpha-glucosidase